MIEKEYVPGGAYANRKHFGQWVDFKGDVPDAYKMAVFDPQTSGGLLMSVEREKLDRLIYGLKERGTLRAQIIGEVIENGTEMNVITVIR